MIDRGRPQKRKRLLGAGLTISHKGLLSATWHRTLLKLTSCLALSLLSAFSLASGGRLSQRPGPSQLVLNEKFLAF
jgi:hypothetical protein